MIRKLLKFSVLVIVAGMAGMAHALVDLNNNNPATNGSLTYASELDISTSGTALADNAQAQNLQARLGVGFGALSSRHVRIDLGGGAIFSNALSANQPSMQIAGNSGTLAQGGKGQSFAVFQFTAAAARSPDDLVVIDVDGIDVVSRAAVTATYRLYETATGASNPNSSAALATASQTAYRFGKALVAKVNAASPETIDVSTNSTKFVGDKVTTNIANISINVDGTTLWSDSAAAALSDLVATGTQLLVSGNFTAVPRQSSGSPDPAKVTLAGSPATSLTESQAAFSIGANPQTNALVKMTVTGSDEIASGSYAGLYDVVAATDSVATDADLGQLSKLEKNGATRSANMMLAPDGVFRNWVRISNNSTISGRVFLRLRNDLGKSITLSLGDVNGQQTTLAAGNATGLIPIQDIFNAAKAKDATFAVGTGGRNKLRLTVDGEFPEGTLALDNLTISQDNSAFCTFL